MKDYATLLAIGSLCVLGCSSDSTQSGGISATAGTSAPTGAAGKTAAAAGTTSAAAGSSGPAAIGGSTASGVAGTTVPSGAAGTGTGAAGSGVAPMITGGTSASGTAGMTAAAGSGVTAGSSSPAAGGWNAIFTKSIVTKCGSCHKPGLVIGSPDFSTAEKAYNSLVGKDASMEVPGQCGGKGKLVTPGNCETSLFYNKISQATPMCGSRMPPGTMALPQPELDEICAWIKAGAKND